MSLQLFNCKIYISFPMAAALTVVLTADTTGMCLCCILAAICHELAHIIAMALQHTGVKSITVSLFDIDIKDVNKGKRSFIGELTVILSGPFVNIILSVISCLIFNICSIDFLFNFARANLVLGIFNALPVVSLDGGNALVLFLQRNLQLNSVDTVMKIVSLLIVVPMGIAGFLILFASSYNFTLLFTSCYLMCIILMRNY